MSCTNPGQRRAERISEGGERDLPVAQVDTGMRGFFVTSCVFGLIEKGGGDSVVGGAINGNGTLVVRVTATGEASFLHQVVRSLEDARALKPGLLHLVDRVLRVYTPTVLIVSALAFGFWMSVPLLWGAASDPEWAVFAALPAFRLQLPAQPGLRDDFPFA